MKRIFELALTAGFLVATAGQVAAEDIRKENKFREVLADKRLVAGNTWVIISSDGKISGETNGTKFVGAWAWNKRFWCRTLVVGGESVPQDCQKVTLDGNQVTFTRNKGNGESGGTYTITN